MNKSYKKITDIIDGNIDGPATTTKNGKYITLENLSNPLTYDDDTGGDYVFGGGPEQHDDDHEEYDNNNHHDDYPSTGHTPLNFNDHHSPHSSNMSNLQQPCTYIRCPKCKYPKIVNMCNPTGEIDGICRFNNYYCERCNWSHTSHNH